MRLFRFKQMLEQAMTTTFQIGDWKKEIPAGSIGPFAKLLGEALAATLKNATPEDAMKLISGQLVRIDKIEDIIKAAGFEIEFEEVPKGVHVDVYGPRDSAHAAELAAFLANKEATKHHEASQLQKMQEIVDAGGNRPRVAYGYSVDKVDSLLHAVSGAVSEELERAWEVARREHAEWLAEKLKKDLEPKGAVNESGAAKSGP